MSYKYSKEIVDNIIKILELGGSEKNAYEFVGITNKTFYNWKKDKEEFLHRVNEAKQVAYTKVIEALQKAVSRGNVDAIKYWLNNRCSQDWKNKNHVELTERKEFVIKEVRELIAKIDVRSDKERKSVVNKIRELAT